MQVVENLNRYIRTCEKKMNESLKRCDIKPILVNKDPLIDFEQEAKYYLEQTEYD